MAYGASRATVLQVIQMPLHTHKVAFANTLRGFAALLVLIHHYGGVFWNRREDVSRLLGGVAPLSDNVTTPLAIRLASVIPFDLGLFAVSLFFLVSGFVIPFSLKRYSGPRFLAARAVRLLPVYAAGFSVTIASLGIIAQVYGLPFPYTLSEVLIHYVLGIRDLLWSANIDGGIWTLEIELKFYIVGAALAFWMRRDHMLVFAAPMVLMGAGLAVNASLGWLEANQHFWFLRGLVAASTIPFLCYMFAGVAFHQALTLGSERKAVLTGALAVGSTLCGLAVLASSPYAAQTGRHIVSAGLALCVFAGCFSLRATKILAGGRATNFLADISYPLYVSHGIFGYVILYLLLDRGINQMVALTLATIIAFVVAILIHRIVERPTIALARSVASHAV